MRELALRKETVSHGPAGRRRKVVSSTIAKRLQGLGLIEPEAVGRIPSDDDWAIVSVAKEHWIEVPILEGTWIAAFRVFYRGGVPTFAELRVFPAEPMLSHDAPGLWSGEWSTTKPVVPTGGLTARVLKGVKPGVARNELRRMYQRLATVIKSAPEGSNAAARKWFSSRGINQPMAHPARARVSPLELAITAGLYVLAFRTTRSVNQEVARRRGISVRKATDWIQRARNENILTRGVDGQRGNPGGALTTRGRDLLKATPKGRSILRQLDQGPPLDTLPDTPSNGHGQKRRTQANKKR